MWRRIVGEFGGTEVGQELRQATVLLATGGNGSPHSLVVTLASVAAYSLRDTRAPTIPTPRFSLSPLPAERRQRSHWTSPGSVF
jgi:hypothetical protein